MYYRDNSNNEELGENVVRASCQRKDKVRIGQNSDVDDAILRNRMYRSESNRLICSGNRCFRLKATDSSRLGSAGAGEGQTHG
jgi:hypothetical protein